MGLGFDRADAHWSYSGFHSFRCKLCNEAGLGNLEEYEGFGKMDWGIFKDKEKEILKPWNNVEDDIKLFLYHSDCEGFLTIAQMKKIAPRIKELVKNWKDDDYDKVQALLLIKGMEGCILDNKKLRFC